MKRLLKIAALILIGSFLALQVYLSNPRVICKFPSKPYFAIDTVSYGLFEETIPQTGRIEIDTRDKETYCVQVEIDQLYLSRISKGLKATTNVDNENYELEITEVYPVLFNGRFNVDMKFIGKQPHSLRNSSLRMRILLSEPSNQLLVPVGGFYKDTGGKWMFVLNGDKATKRQVTLGRKSPDYFEVIEGLHAGDRVITSSYENFINYDSINILEMKKRNENKWSFINFLSG